MYLVSNAVAAIFRRRRRWEEVGELSLFGRFNATCKVIVQAVQGARIRELGIDLDQNAVIAALVIEGETV